MNEAGEKTGMDAIRAVTTLSALADKIGVTRGAVSQWDRVPAEKIKQVSEATGLSYKVLRPDLFPQPAARGEVV